MFRVTLSFITLPEAFSRLDGLKQGKRGCLNIRVTASRSIFQIRWIETKNPLPDPLFRIDLPEAFSRLDGLKPAFFQRAPLSCFLLPEAFSRLDGLKRKYRL